MIVIQYKPKVGNKPSLKIISCQYFDFGVIFKDPKLVEWDRSKIIQLQTYTRYILLAWMDEINVSCEK